MNDFEESYKQNNTNQIRKMTDTEDKEIDVPVTIELDSGIFIYNNQMYRFWIN